MCLKTRNRVTGGGIGDKQKKTRLSHERKISFVRQPLITLNNVSVPHIVKRASISNVSVPYIAKRF